MPDFDAFAVDIGDLPILMPHDHNGSVGSERADREIQPHPMNLRSEI